MKMDWNRLQSHCDKLNLHQVAEQSHWLLCQYHMISFFAKDTNCNFAFAFILFLKLQLTKSPLALHCNRIVQVAIGSFVSCDQQSCLKVEDFSTCKATKTILHSDLYCIVYWLDNFWIERACTKIRLPKHINSRYPALDTLRSLLSLYQGQWNIVYHLILHIMK